MPRCRPLNAVRVALGLALLGAATSVLVAWGVAASGVGISTSNSLSGYLLGHREGLANQGFLRRYFGWTIVMWVSGEDSGDPNQAYSLQPWKYRIDDNKDKPRQMGRPPLLPLYRCYYGWPQLALMRENQSLSRPASGKWSVSRGTLQLGSASLPYFVIWQGLLFNALFWGGVWSVPLVLVPALIRRRRERNGHCSRCGYDKRGLDGCPECGPRVIGDADA